MLAIYLVASPDRSLAWLIYVLLAFLLIGIVVGAIVGSRVFDAGAPGALRETQTAAPVNEEPAAEIRPQK